MPTAVCLGEASCCAVQPAGGDWRVPAETLTTDQAWWAGMNRSAPPCSPIRFPAANANWHHPAIELDVASGIDCCRLAACRVLVFSFGKELIGPAGYFGKPYHVCLRVVPVDVDLQVVDLQ